MNAAVQRKTRFKHPPLAVGEVWHVRLPGAQTLVTVVVDQITEHTVVLTLNIAASVWYSGSLGRFVRKEVEFIERVL